MTRCIYTRSGQRVERRSHLPTARIHRRPGIPAVRPANWRALPVEGSKAWRDSRPLLSRIFSR